MQHAGVVVRGEVVAHPVAVQNDQIAGCESQGLTGLTCVDTDGDGIGDAPRGCIDEIGGFRFTVPLSKEFRITDVILIGGDLLWTDLRGVVMFFQDGSVSMTNPLIIDSGETVCSVKGGDTNPALLIGSLVDAT